MARPSMRESGSVRPGAAAGATRSSSSTPTAPKTRVSKAAISSSRLAVRRSETVTTRPPDSRPKRSEEHTSELQSHSDLVCRLLLEKKKKKKKKYIPRNIKKSQQKNK